MPEKLSPRSGESQNTNDNPWGDSYRNSVPPFNPEQKETKTSPELVIIDTLHDRYVNQVATEEANREVKHPSLSDAEFSDLRFKSDLIRKAYVAEGLNKHDEDFSYSNYFRDLSKAALDEAWLKEDGAEIHKFEDGTSSVILPGLSGGYDYGTGNIGANEFFTTLGIDRSNINTEQLSAMATALDEIAQDADRLQHDLASPIGLSSKIRPRQKTLQIDKKERMEQREQEYIEKFGPEIYLERIIDSDEAQKVAKINQELRAYKIKESTPGPEQIDGMRLAGAPDPAVVKGFEDDIAEVQRKAKEERVLYKEMILSGQYRDDALSDLRNTEKYLRNEINNPNNSQQTENKKKLATVHRLIAKIERNYGESSAAEGEK